MITQYCVQCGAELGEKDRFCTECGAPRSRPQDHTPQRVKKTNNLSLPVIVLIAGVLLLLGGAAVYLLGGSDAAPAVSEAPAGAAESDIPFPEVARISVEEARASAEAGTAVIVDVRSREDYETLHVTNALSIPLAELPDRTAELPQDAEILTYCTWPSEESSARAAAILEELGFSNVKAIRGGFSAWRGAGYPTASGGL